MLEILRNDCFSVDQYRYRYLTSMEESVYVIDLDNRNALPIRWNQSLVQEMVRAQRIKRIDKVMPVRPHTERLQDRGRGEMRLAHVQALIDMPGIWHSVTRGPLLRAYAKKVRISKDALLDWLRKYWQGGQCLEALLGNYHRSGKVTALTPGAIAIHIQEEAQEAVRFMSGSARRRGALPRSVSGARADPPRYIPYAPTEAERLEIARIAWQHYGADKSKSMNGAVTRVLATLYIERDAHGNALYDEDGVARLLPEGRRPSKHQIYRLINNTKSLSEGFKERFGTAYYDNNVKPRVGSVLDDCNGPGDVYEVDATVLDVHIVDRKTRQTIIGKPTFYVVTDRASHLIVGFHVGLDNPSWNEAKLSIMCISANWKKMAKALKVKLKDSDLIANGRYPNRFVADRGNDLLYTGSERLCDGMEIQVTNTRALHPVSKAIVESHFKGLPTQLRQFAPGYEPPEDLGERRVKPHAKSAAMTLDALRRVLMQLVIARNRTPLKNYRATAKEIYLQAGLSPLAIWQRGIETMTSYGSRYDYDYVREKLKSRGIANVYANGLKFRDCLFDSPEIREWRVKAMLNDGFEVAITFEASCVNEITVLDPDDSSRRFTAKQVDPRWNNYSFAEQSDARKEQLQNELLGQEEARKQQVNALHHNDFVVAEEQALTNAATEGMTFGARKSAGPAALEDEKKRRRLEVHEVHQPAGQQDDDATAEHSVGEPVADATVSATGPEDIPVDGTAESRGDSTPPLATESSDDGPLEALGSGFDVGSGSDDILERLLNESEPDGADWSEQGDEVTAPSTRQRSPAPEKEVEVAT